MSHSLDIAKINENSVSQDGVSAIINNALPNLVGMPRETLKQILADLGIKEKAIKMRTAQIWH